eukprot:3655825-Alexandrium_andersonii.AAC.1
MCIRDRCCRLRAAQVRAVENDLLPGCQVTRVVSNQHERRVGLAAVVLSRMSSRRRRAFRGE